MLSVGRQNGHPVHKKTWQTCILTMQIRLSVTLSTRYIMWVSDRVRDGVSVMVNGYEVASE